MPKLPASLSLPSWPAWLQMVLACFVGALAGGYVAAKIAITKSEESLRVSMEMQSIDRFLSMGGEVLKDENKMTPLGTPALIGLGFYTIDNANDVRQAILYGSTLPGIRQLHFAPFGVNKMSAGFADGDMMRFAHRNFADIEYLDISNCRLEDAAALQPMVNLKRLKIANNPLTENGVQALGLLDSVSELWIGWPDRTLTGESMYRSDSFRKAMVKGISEMNSLKRVHLYDVQLTGSEKMTLQKLEIVPAYLE